VHFLCTYELSWSSVGDFIAFTLDNRLVAYAFYNTVFFLGNFVFIRAAISAPGALCPDVRAASLFDVL